MKKREKQDVKCRCLSCGAHVWIKNGVHLKHLSSGAGIGAYPGGLLVTGVLDVEGCRVDNICVCWDCFRRVFASRE